MVAMENWGLGATDTGLPGEGATGFTEQDEQLHPPGGWY